MIYLDHCASTPTRPGVVAAMLPHFSEHFANPHSDDHAAGWAASSAIEEARAEVATRIGANPDEIVFTSGATEANNLAILGSCHAHGSGRNVVVSSIEHKAVLGPARELGRRGYEVRIAPVGRDGVTDSAAMAALIDARTSLVALMLVNNEVGTVQRHEQVANACSRTGALLHVDAAQALGWMDFDVDDLRADLLSLSAHKAGGPKGVGALYVRGDARDRMRPLLHGGEQEGALRPGTLPTPLCVGLGAAVRDVPRPETINLWRRQTEMLERRLLSAIPTAQVNGLGASRHPGCTSLTLRGCDADLIVSALQPEVAVSRGSACTSGLPEPSHVLRAMGLTTAEAMATLRISTAPATSEAELDAFMDMLLHAVRTVEQVSGLAA